MGRHPELVQIPAGHQPHSKRGITLFTKSGVKEILSNPVYVGDINHRGAVLPGTHAAIIDRALFAAVQARRRAPRPGRPAAGHRVYLLSGIGRHAGCESPLWADTDLRYRVPVPRYVCSARESGLVTACAGRVASGATVDAEVSAVFEQIVLPRDWRGFVEEEIAQLRAAVPADPDGSRKSALEARRARRAVLDELVPYDEAAATIREIDAACSRISGIARSTSSRSSAAMLSIGSSCISSPHSRQMA